MFLMTICMTSTTTVAAAAGIIIIIIPSNKTAMCENAAEELGEKPIPVPLCPPQIPHGLTCA
jgi:hypothetical protein